MIPRPRPRLAGNENPALTGEDKIGGNPFGTDASKVLPDKMGKGAQKARVDSVKSARKLAAMSMMKGNEDGQEY